MWGIFEGASPIFELFEDIFRGQYEAWYHRFSRARVVPKANDHIFSPIDMDLLEFGEDMPYHLRTHRSVVFQFFVCSVELVAVRDYFDHKLRLLIGAAE